MKAKLLLFISFICMSQFVMAMDGKKSFAMPSTLRSLIELSGIPVTLKYIDDDFGKIVTVEYFDHAKRLTYCETNNQQNKNNSDDWNFCIPKSYYVSVEVFINGCSDNKHYLIPVWINRFGQLFYRLGDAIILARLMHRDRHGYSTDIVQYKESDKLYPITIDDFFDTTIPIDLKYEQQIFIIKEIIMQKKNRNSLENKNRR